MIPLVRAAVLAAAVAGCTLIDQATFAPEPDPKPTPKSALASPAGTTSPADTRAPLLTIRYDVPSPDYGTVLPLAIHTAQQRRPGVGFDVVSVIPSAVEAAQGQVDAAEIARAIGKLGTPATQVHLAVRIDPSGTLRQVLVYLR